MENEPITIITDEVTLLAVIGCCQIGLRHPQNVGPTSAIVKNFIDGVTPELTRRDTFYRVLIDAGWNSDTGN